MTLRNSHGDGWNLERVVEGLSNPDPERQMLPFPFICRY